MNLEKDTIKKNFTYARRSTKNIYIYFKKQIILLMKILPTIGPETIKSKNLKYILNKTEIVRINSSHNTIAWHKSAIRKIKKIKPNSVILIDFPGVKPRTKNITPLKIKKNQIITFKYGNNSKANEILLTKPLPKK